MTTPRCHPVEVFPPRGLEHDFLIYRVLNNMKGRETDELAYKKFIKYIFSFFFFTNFYHLVQLWTS